jgi:acetylornithine deacetylase/succinyl-diaminopimelate desuccinylase-like protein
VWQWETNGLLDQSIQVLVDWVRAQKVEGLTVEIVAKKGFTPVIFVEVEPTPSGSDAGTVLMYGHADTQPPFVGWNEDLDPYKANLKGEKLYGRGACDDGYSIFCAVSSIMAVKAQGLDHGRLLVLVEASEESGSIHLPQHLCVHPSDIAPYALAWRCSTVPTVLAGAAEQGYPKTSDRHAEPHRMPRFWLWELRAALGDNILAWSRCR